MKIFTLLRILTFALLTTIIIISCKKDIHQDITAQDLTQLKNFYNNSLKNNGLNGFVSALVPDWNAVYASTTDSNVVYEIDCSNPKNIINGKSKLTAANPKDEQSVQAIIKLLMFKSQEGIISARFMVLSGNSSKWAKLHYVGMDNLNGSAIFYDLNSQFIDGKIYVDGKMTKSLMLAPRDTPLDQMLNLSNTQTSRGGGKVMLEDVNTDCTYVQWYVNELICDGENCHWIEVDSFLVKECQSSGGDNDGPPQGGSPDPTQTDELDSILKDTCLNAVQMRALRTMFSEYLSGQGDADLKCAQSAIYKKINSLGKKFGFCIDSAQVSPGGDASYKPGSGVIYYKFEEGIPVVTPFRHEFFHGFQDAFYAGGTSQYNTGTRTGFPNLEFEQALFYDIVNGSGSATAMGSTASTIVRNEYENWIKDITNNNTTYPKQFSDFGGHYYYFLGLFYQSSAYAGIGTVNHSLQPFALLNIFSTSNCK